MCLRERERQPDRLTDKQTDRKKGRGREREREKWRFRERERYSANRISYKNFNHRFLLLVI